MFNKETIGISISDRTIEVVLVNKEKESFYVKERYQTSFGEGVFENGEVINGDMFLAIFEPIKAKKWFQSGATLILGIPESLVYYNIVSVSEDEKIESKVNDEIAKIVPIRSDSILYEIKDLGNRNFLVISWDKDKTNSIVQLLQKAGINVGQVNSELLSFMKVLNLSEFNKDVLVIDIGSTSTIIGMFNKSGLVYSEQIPIGGEDMTKAISESKGVSFDEAEKYKRDRGLDESDSQVFFALTVSLKKLVDNLKDTIKYIEKKANFKPKEVLLVGGGSNTLNIEKYMEDNLEIKTSLGVNSLVKEKKNKIFMEAIGLALLGQSNDGGVDFGLDNKKRRVEDTLVAKSSSDIDQSSKKKIELLILLIAILVLIIVGIYIMYT